MKNVIIVYESADGQTQDVAERIAHTLKGADCHTTISRCKNATEEQLANADGILLGGSIHMGRHNGKLLHFAQTHRELLSRKSAALFLVCLTAKNTSSEAQGLVDGFFEDFKTRSEFTPSHMIAFAGAVKYTSYNFIKRSIMKSILQKEGNDTDTSRDYSYTDWDAVDSYANAFLQRLP